MATGSAPLPVGLIGVGKHGARYLEHIRRDVPALRLVAICRRDAIAGAALAADIGVRFYADPRELVRSAEVRAVIAVAPPTLHRSIIEEAASTRKALLIEKPFAIDAAEAFSLRDRLDASGAPCLVAHTLRYSGVVRALREWLPAIGRPSQLLLGQSFEPSRLGWLDDPAASGGGNVLHTGVHLFDLARHLSGGEVSDVACLLERVVTRRTEDSFAASLGIDAPSGRMLAAVAGSRATRSRHGEIRILGEAGQLLADHVHRTLALIEDRRITRSIEVPDVPTVREILDEFAHVASGERPPGVTAADGAAAVAIADACYRSAQTGARVRVSSSGG